MSRRLLYISVLLLLALPLLAQPRLRQPEMYVGLHGGVMASTIQFSPTVPNMTPITKAVILNGNGGFVFRYSGHKCCGLQVELNYMQRGWREQIEPTPYTRALDYIELPFLAHIYFGSQTWRGFINLGPQIGYCVHDSKAKEVANSGTLSHQYAAIDNRFDWGVTGGLGVYCRTKKAGLYQLEARFGYSLGTIFASRTADYFNNANAMTLSLNLAWLWEIKPNKQRTTKEGL